MRIIELIAKLEAYQRDYGDDLKVVSVCRAALGDDQVVESADPVLVDSEVDGIYVDLTP